MKKILLFIFVFCISYSFSKTISQSTNPSNKTYVSKQSFPAIIVKGNKRIETSTILDYLTFEDIKDCNNKSINDSLKSLYATGLFSKVKIVKEGNKVIIYVSENPIINKISFEGNKKIDDETFNKFFGERIKSRTIFKTSEIKSITKDILMIYMKSGRFLTTIVSKIIYLTDNRVNVVFEINEGPLAVIKKIIFIGNDAFSDSVLKTKLFSKEHVFWKFWSNDDIYASEKLEIDKKQIIDFYKNNGYVDISVISAISELSNDKKSFFLTYKIKEGNPYTVTKINLKSDFQHTNKEALLSKVVQKINKIYCEEDVQESENKILDELSEQGFLFAEVESEIVRTSKNTLTLTFKILRGPKVYIDKITVTGNLITLDSVVRREMLLDEKDAFNSVKLRESTNRIKDLDFFSNVNIDQQPGETDDTVNLTVQVSEKSTAHIELGLGIQIGNGLFGKVGIAERNFLGTGKALSANVIIGQRDRGLSAQIVDPYFMDKKLAMMVEGGFQKIKRSKTTSFSSDSFFVGTSVGYDITKHFSHNIGYRLSFDKIKDTSYELNFFLLSKSTEEYRRIHGLPNPRKMTKKEKDELNNLAHDDFGNKVRSKIYSTFTYARLDSYSSPRSGFVIGLTTEYCGLGGNVHYTSNTMVGKYFFPVGKLLTLMTKVELGTMSSGALLDDKFSLGGDNLKGFEFDGAGPREKFGNEYALRGTKYYAGMVALKIPFIQGDMELNGVVFSQFGALWKSNKNKVFIYDDKKLRMNIGFGFEWMSPMGPIAVTYAYAVKKAKYDQTERFQIGYFITR